MAISTTQHRNLVSDDQDDHETDEHAVNAAGDRIEEQPESLRNRRQRLRGLDAENVPLDQPHRIFGALLAEIGDLQKVGQDVVPVVTQQRVGVEDQAWRPTGDQHRVVAQHGRQRGFVADVHPEKRQQRSDEQLDDHARRADEHAVPAAGKRPRGRRIHVRRGNEHQEHDPQLVTFPAESPARKRVTQLVNQLDENEHRPQPQPVFRIDGIAWRPPSVRSSAGR